MFALTDLLLVLHTAEDFYAYLRHVLLQSAEASALLLSQKAASQLWVSYTGSRLHLLMSAHSCMCPPRCCRADCFQWMCELRSYWDASVSDCRIRICDASFPYG